MQVRLQIDEQLRNVGQMENGQKSAEWEAQVFNRSRTREEYVKLVATLIRKLRSYNKKVHIIGGDATQKYRRYSKFLSFEQIYLSPTLFCSEKDRRLCFVSQFGESVDMTSSKEKDLEFHFKCVGDKCIPQILHKYQAVMGQKNSHCLKFIL